MPCSGEAAGTGWGCAHCEATSGVTRYTWVYLLAAPPSSPPRGHLRWGTRHYSAATPTTLNVAAVLMCVPVLQRGLLVSARRGRYSWWWGSRRVVYYDNQGSS